MINAHKLFINMAMDKQRKNVSNQKPLALKTPSNKQLLRQVQEMENDAISLMFF